MPRGLPFVELPDLEFVWNDIAVIMSSAIGLLLIGFSQTAGDARAFASKHRYRGPTRWARSPDSPTTRASRFAWLG